MNTKIFLFLAVLPLMSRADNTIRVNFWTSDNNETMINAAGVTNNVINHGDMHVFGITGDGLKSGIQAISGATPDNVFLSDPTGDFGHQFAINNWPETYINLEVESYELLNSGINTRVISQINFTNYGEPTIWSANVTFSVFDWVQNKWPSHSEQETGQPIKYDFNFQDGKIKMNFVNNWGRTSVYTRKKELRAGTSQPVDTQQLLLVSYVLVEGQGEARVTYRASLDGNAIGHFSQGHYGRNFWPFEVNSAVQMGQMSPKIRITEDITYVYSAQVYTEYIFKDLRREVHPGVIFDMEDNLIVNPTKEEIENVIKYKKIVTE